MTDDPNIYFVCVHFSTDDATNEIVNLHATSAPDFTPTDANLVASFALPPEVFAAFQRKFFAYAYIDAKKEPS